MFPRSPIDSDIQSSEDKHNGFVKIWKSKAGSVGHVAIQLGGKKPKRLKKHEGDYNSLWPEGFPAFGPLAFFPLKAGLAKTLNEDEKREAKTNTMSMNDLNPRGLFQQKNKRTKADIIYRIKNLDNKKMGAELSELKTGVAKGSVRYQLFPSVNLLLSSKYMENPFTHLQEPSKAAVEAPKKYNCVTFVRTVLNAGGVNLEESIWSPNMFNKHLAEHPEYFEVVKPTR